MAQRRLSRRQILFGSLGVVTGCRTTPLRADSASRRGGHLRAGVAGASTSDTLDPATFYSNYQSIVGYAFANTLLEIGPTGDLQPALVESWEASSDLRTWRFELRPGVEFHNGRSLTAADAVATLNRHRTPEVNSGARPYLQIVDRIERRGARTFEIALSASHATFPYVLTDYHLLIQPADGSPTDGAGTGPFVMESFEPGIVWRGRRNPNYWKNGRPYVDAVSILGVNDATARTNALRSGEVDLISDVDPVAAPRIETEPGLQLFVSRGGGHVTLPMQVDEAPFNSRKVREALKLAVDRERIARDVYNGYARVGNDHPIAPSSAAAADLPAREHDPERARALLAAAGVERRLTLHSSPVPARGIELAETIQAHAQAAGLEIEVRRHPADGYWSEVWRRRAWCASMWSGRPTPDMIFSVVYASGAVWNETDWSNAQFDRLLSEARAEPDPAARAELYERMQALVRNDGGTILPVFVDWLDAGTARLCGFEPSVFDEFAGKRAPEQVWFAPA